MQELSKYAYWDEDCYTRNLIKRTKKYELILLCWEAGQKTPIHCHSGQECWVYLAAGKLEETQFKVIGGDLQQTKKEKITDRSIAFINDSIGLHSLHNTSNGRSVSLHLYMDPIECCSVYNDQTQEFEPSDLSYHSVGGVPCLEEAYE